MASIQDVFQYEAMKHINKSESQYLRLHLFVQFFLSDTGLYEYHFTCLQEITK